MMNDKELLNVRGGEVSLGTVLLIVSGFIFLVGVIDGFFRPYECRK